MRWIVLVLLAACGREWEDCADWVLFDSCGDGLVCSESEKCERPYDPPPPPPRRVDVPIGGACQGPYECVAGASCDASTSTCQPLHARAAGEACSDPQFCQGSLTCLFELCQPPPAEGERCQENQDCPGGLVCRGVPGDERCLALGLAGEWCTDDLDCAEGNPCNGGYDPPRCTYPAWIGDPCVDSRDCASGLTCNHGYPPGECHPPGTTGDPCGDSDDCERARFCAQAACT